MTAIRICLFAAALFRSFPRRAPQPRLALRPKARRRKKASQRFEITTSRQKTARGRRERVERDETLAPSLSG
jgi:hypothetical protein